MNRQLRIKYFTYKLKWLHFSQLEKMGFSAIAIMLALLPFGLGSNVYEQQLALANAQYGNVSTIDRNTNNLAYVDQSDDSQVLGVQNEANLLAQANTVQDCSSYFGLFESQVENSYQCYRTDQAIRYECLPGYYNQDFACISINLVPQCLSGTNLFEYNLMPENSHLCQDSNVNVHYECDAGYKKENYKCVLEDEYSAGSMNNLECTPFPEDTCYESAQAWRACSLRYRTLLIESWCPYDGPLSSSSQGGTERCTSDSDCKTGFSCIDSVADGGGICQEVVDNDCVPLPDNCNHNNWITCVPETFNGVSLLPEDWCPPSETRSACTASDLNNDGIVNMADLDLIKNNMFRRPSSYDLVSKMDMNNDNLIDVTDYSVIVRDLGLTNSCGGSADFSRQDSILNRAEN